MGRRAGTHRMRARRANALHTDAADEHTPVGEQDGGREHAGDNNMTTTIAPGECPARKRNTLTADELAEHDWARVRGTRRGQARALR